MAIQQQVPIVPLTLVNNYKILPDHYPIRMSWGRVSVVFHEPIPTIGLTQADMPALKEQTFRVIDAELHHSITQYAR